MEDNVAVLINTFNLIQIKYVSLVIIHVQNVNFFLKIIIIKSQK
jgi:hypothetical protein